MDKNTRLLLLYSKLIQGESVNKLTFCMETDSHPRSFDRDIEDIRLYLSETFSGEELRYSKQENACSLTGVRQVAKGGAKQREKVQAAQFWPAPPGLYLGIDGQMNS